MMAVGAMPIFRPDDRSGSSASCRWPVLRRTSVRLDSCGHRRARPEIFVHAHYRASMCTDRARRPSLFVGRG